MKIAKEPTKKPEEIFSELVTNCNELYKKANRALQDSRILYEKLEKEMRDLKLDSVTLLRTVTQKFTTQTQVIDDLRKITISTEDALLNVLLAIRQNEYLQAYYPEQHGYQSMKVTGTHLAKIYGPCEEPKINEEEKKE